MTIPYGLDELPAAPLRSPREAAGIPSGVPLLLAVGRLIAQKDHATLLRAFLARPGAASGGRLAILGSGPLEAEIRTQIRRARARRAVVLPGRLGIRDWLEHADVFVHSSRWEGFGIVLLEAMLAGAAGRRDAA